MILMVSVDVHWTRYKKYEGVGLWAREFRV